MFDPRTHRTQFLSAPPSVSSVVAAVMEPCMAVVTLVACHIWSGQPFGRVAMVTSILLLVLMFPGTNRFRQSGISVGIDITLSWVSILLVLGLVGYASDSLTELDRLTLQRWIAVTPIVLWIATASGSWYLRRLAARPQSRRPAVIIGAGSVGIRLAHVLHYRQPFGHDLLGFFEERDASRLDLPASMKLLGNYDALPAYIAQHGVKDVYVTLPLSSQPRIQRIIEELNDTTSSLYYAPDVFGVNIIQGRLQDLGGIPIVGLRLTPFEGINGLIKRVSDIVLASLILLLISPLLLILALGVKLSSPGPVIFKQRRNGLDGKVITVYKFRSMRVMEDGAVVTQATRGDPRITPFGAFIRKTSLDELPQFINVLQGRMSIVGPRPHAVAHNEAYRRRISAYAVRHKVRPGITGWAQVNGLRGETDTDEKMARRIAYDLEYLRDWSIGLDLLIIARTIKLVFADSKAH